MASCEKCWVESCGNYEEYMQLLKINKCTPEEQAGKGAKKCLKCGKNTVHIYAHVCMNCGEKQGE